MSNKSGIAEQLISLPNGGGELKGLGESFSADLHTGTGNFAVPIAVPSGRNGFQPELALSYSTGNGNSCFGLGWQLSIPGVSRKTAKGIPRYQDGQLDQPQDTFLLSGAEDLVPVEKGNNWIQYRPRTEGLFAVIRRYLDAQNDYWEVKTKDGTVSLYGTPQSRSSDPAVCADPNDPNKVFEWKLTQTIDPFGSRILYTYVRDRGTEDRLYDQLYLDQIQYLDYLAEDQTEKFLARVEFVYEYDRPDPFSVYTSGFEVRTERRCRQIITKTFPDQQELWVRSYNLEYQQADHSQVSLLSSVQVVGHDEEQTEPLPPIMFQYSTFSPAGKDFRPIEGQELPTTSLAAADTELVDLFGNGLPDIIRMNGTVQYWKNLGHGTFDLPRTMNNAPAGFSIASPNVQFLDATGQGKVDLMVNENGISGYFPTDHGQGWDNGAFRRFDATPNFNLNDPEVRFVDLDGDGVTDLLRTGTRLECYFNKPGEGWTSMLQVPRADLADFPNVNLSDPRVRLADMSGDGLQDIVLVSNRNVTYWPYMGYGKWGKRIRMSNSPRFPANYDPKRLLIGDIAGDGPHDFVYVDHAKTYIWINQNGNGFSDPIIIEGTPLVGDTDAVRLLDLQGDGTSGILWSSDQLQPGRANFYFLDLTEGIKPFLLNEMKNNMGAITKVTYRSSTHYYLEDDGNADSRWQTPLPFPVQVVASVEVIDEISRSKLSTDYSYHHGYWDGAEREFRGFGRVEQTDTQSFEQYNDSEAVGEGHYSPPMLTKTWFHQGPVGEEFGEWGLLDYSNEYWSGDPQKFNLNRGVQQLLRDLPRRAQRDAHRSLSSSVLRTELYALDDDDRASRPFTVTESYYIVRNEFDPNDATDVPLPNGNSGYIFFPINSIQRTTQWERGDDPRTNFDFTEAFDAWGNAMVQVAIACPRGWRNMGDKLPETRPFLATYTHQLLAYSPNEYPFIKGKTAKASSYEILHLGEQGVWDMKAATQNDDRLQLIAQTITYFDGPAFEGLPFRQIGQFGVPIRSESLVIDEARLQELWTDELGNLELPPYFTENADWPTSYPEAFQAAMPAMAGYRFYDGSGVHARGYWTSQQMRYDFQGDEQGFNRGLILDQRDVLGRISNISYDKYQFMPISAVDPLGMKISAENDYRLFQPFLSADPNDNVSMVTFTPLGFVAASYLIGKEGKLEGDAIDRNDPNAIPSIANEYDFLAFMNEANPIYVRSVAREYHLYDENIPEGRENDSIISIKYADGFGRLVQTRIQAEDRLYGDALLGNELLPEDQEDPAVTNPLQATNRQADEAMNVVVSGWQLYDNKGRVVQRYEPFYSKGFDFADLLEEDLHTGQKVEQFYDPLGHVIRTLNPDGSEQRVIFGIPNILLNPPTDPSINFTPTPWEAYTFDENDLAPITGHADQIDESHWLTPASIELDALGRTIKSISRNGQSPDDELITRSTYDIRGNLLSTIDPLGRTAFRYFYDLSFDEEQGSQVWRIDSIDAGTRIMIFNALGLEIERRNGKGGVSMQVYDQGDRLTKLWTKDEVGLPITLRQQMIYGDTLSSAADGWTAEKAQNLLGQLYQHYDEAGVVEISAFDMKGNPLSTSRRVIRDEVLIALPRDLEFQHFQIDWTPEDASANLLENRLFQTETYYDALNRPIWIRYPEDVYGDRKILIPQYNRAGSLESIRLSGAEQLSPSEGQGAGVHYIAYNARGQRTLVAFNNGLMCRYAYDDRRFWLTRLRTERYDRTAAENFEFIPNGGLLQDLAYELDLVGNIVKIKDRSPGAGVPNSQLGQEALDRIFAYDPIYRLISASGREHTARHPIHNEPWQQALHHTNQDINATRSYTRQYSYDKAGNMLMLKHITPNSAANFTRNFHTRQSENLSETNVESWSFFRQGNNRLEWYEQGSIQHNIAYDDNGNMVSEGISRLFFWNYTDQLHGFRVQPNEDAEPSLEARYLYDAAGQRVKKIVWRQGGKINTTTYIGSAFEYHQEVQAGTVKENNSLHLMDVSNRIALIRVGQPLDEQDSTVAVQYQLGDHLGHVHFVVDNTGAWLNREEYYPFGATSFGGFSSKRYHFTGKERDNESGLNYHAARYYAPWLVKWASADPKGDIDGLNLYRYGRNNPTLFTDPDGTEAIPESVLKNQVPLDELLKPMPKSRPKGDLARLRKMSRSKRRRLGLNKRAISMMIRDASGSPLKSYFAKNNSGVRNLVTFHYELSATFTDKRGKRYQLAFKGIISDGKINIGNIVTANSVGIKLSIHAEATILDGSSRVTKTDLFEDSQVVKTSRRTRLLELELHPEILTVQKNQSIKKHDSRESSREVTPSVKLTLGPLEAGQEVTLGSTRTRGKEHGDSTSYRQRIALDTFKWYQFHTGTDGKKRAQRIDIPVSGNN